MALLSALVATQTFATGHDLTLDARAAGLAVAAAAVLARAPFLVVVAARPVRRRSSGILLGPVMTCGAVTFDFNGTLSDDEEILFGVYAALFAEHGRPLGRAEYYAGLAGLSEHEIARAWLGDREDLEMIVRKRIDRYRRAVTDGTTVSERMRAAVGTPPLVRPLPWSRSDPGRD